MSDASAGGPFGSDRSSGHASSRHRRLIDGDIVEVVGPAGGVYTCLTVAGAEKSIPQIDAIELRIL
jgi:hypothetical protein